MANVTDPLVAALTGTDPQNLMEYITRQKIYDSRYWKEECFGLTAVQVLEKATKLKTMGGSYGGNAQPTKFLCLVLKLLQIQPEDELVEEFVNNEDFKYVRALGCFYKRLTGRPADIYELLEPLYRDFRKLRNREPTQWTILRMDEFIHQLLTEERVCGVALPRLAQRETLVEAGYLQEETRPTALQPLLEQYGGPHEYLRHKAQQQGSVAAKRLVQERRQEEEEKRKKESAVRADTRRRQEEHDTSRYRRPEGMDREWRDLDGRDRRGGDPHDHYHQHDRKDLRRHERRRDDTPRHDDGRRRDDDERGCKTVDHQDYEASRKERSRKKRKKDPKYGTLFSKDSTKEKNDEHDTKQRGKEPEGESSKEYWSEQRAKLGLKPLRE